MPGRIAAYAPDDGGAANPTAGTSDALLAKVRTRGPGIARLLADWLRGIRCRPTLAEAMRARGELAASAKPSSRRRGTSSARRPSRSSRPTANCTACSRASASSRSSAPRSPARATRRAAARAALAALETEQDEAQTQYHAESLAFTSQQRRCHDLELELLQLRKAAEAAEKRRQQIAAEHAEIARRKARSASRRRRSTPSSPPPRRASTRKWASATRVRHTRNEADVALARGRERARTAERAAQEAAFAERSCRDRIAELGVRGETLAAQAAQQRELLTQLTSERAAVDWTPVEEALQRQLGVRAEAEQALAAARDRLEALGTDLRAAEEARMTCEQKLEPARAKIEETRLKEQAAVLQAQQFAEQLAEAHAVLEGMAERLKAFGNKSTLAPEIERLQGLIAGFGAVNLAALDELGIATERKQYLDAQAADLTEAMATLENAIRQIDRESRQLLQQTFEAVNVNFATLFPALFGGGQAKLVLTGEEILDSGVQVVAQPPGQAQFVDPPAVGRREGADRDLAGVRAVPAQSGAVLPAGRSRRAARRSQHRPLLPDGEGDVGADAVPVHLAQQDHDGDGEPAHRHHDAGARRVARRCRRHRRSARARRLGRRRRLTLAAAPRRGAESTVAVDG